jgi:hypothetical protein
MTLPPCLQTYMLLPNLDMIKSSILLSQLLNGTRNPLKNTFDQVSLVTVELQIVPPDLSMEIKPNSNP